MLDCLSLLETDEEKKHFILLYKVYHRQLYHAATHLVNDISKAEDMVHDTYIRLTNHLHKIDQSIYPTLADYLKQQKKDKNLLFTDYLKFQHQKDKEICYKTWGYLSSILKSIIYNHHRKDKREIILSELDDFEEWIHDGIEHLILENEKLSHLQKLILDLPYTYRQVLHLQYYQGLSTTEIAKILDKSPDNIRHISKRAKEKLKKMLEKRGYIR